LERDEILWALEDYEHDVSRLPDRVNPYGEMENILDGRDIIEDGKTHLSDADLQRLNRADERLREHADKVYALLGRDPKQHRENHNVPRSRWWWYVDELAKAGTA
jgi:hypothetical protein